MAEDFRIGGDLGLKENRKRSSLGILKATSPLLFPKIIEPSSPQPSVDRLSVTFAISDENVVETSRNERFAYEKVREIIGTTKNLAEMQRISIADDEEGDEEDYSASACAIMQRKSSTRRPSRRKRRSSSPFVVEPETTLRRRSSVYTISSGETAISMEDSGNQEQIFEKLKLHKEILGGVKQQPWPLRKKIKLVRQAKSYVRRHEGVLQERLAQTRSTKDAIARVSLFTTKKWQYFRRELVNLQTWLVPWELRIKEIESHFGSAVASYFTFLRWLFWINLVISAAITIFVAIPEVLIADPALAGERKVMLKEEGPKSKHLLTLWEFEGLLKYSPFFYGWYTNQDSENGYRLPLAYFITNLVVYTYSFVAILRKMAENSRLSKLTEKEDECAFSWKLFTGWDFMIGNPETAHNRVASIVLGFKEALLEEAEKEKDERNWKIISMRIFVNLSVISLLILSAYAVVEVVGRSAGEFVPDTWWRQNEITVVMSLITYLFPIFFEILGLLESYHPRKQLRVQLARIMVLNLLNLYSLIFALFGKINTMKQDLRDLKPTNKTCRYEPIKCNDDVRNSPSYATIASLSLILMSNLSDVRVKNPIVRETRQSSFTVIPEGFYLNPIIDNATLEEIYNVGDYLPLDYDDENYDGIILNNLNETTLFDFKNTTSQTPREIETSEATSSDTLTQEFENSTMVNTIFSENTSTPDQFSTTEKNSMINEETTSRNNEVTTVIDDSSMKSKNVVEQNSIVKCFEQVCTTTQDTGPSMKRLDLKTRKKLRRLCWETMFGQELAKLTVMDLVLTIVATLSIDFFRAVFVRFMNTCWCWDLEKQFPQYGDFKIAENILHLVNNQGMVWMGMFFSPGLTALNLLKLGIIMYLRSWTVLTCNVPHEIIFRASRSNNFYFALLLTMLFLCVLPVGYAIVWVEPSWHCGPFSGYKKIYHLVTKKLTNSLPKPIQRCFDYIASPGIVIPLIVLMTLIIYYMASLASSLREANNDLKIQLRHERTEERRKLFRIVEKRQELMDNSFGKWKKVLPISSEKSGKPISNGSKDDPESAIVLENTIDAEDLERKRQTSFEAERDSLSHESMTSQYIPENHRQQRGTTRISNSSRAAKILGESWDSQQSSDCGAIPEIRINEAEGRIENQPDDHEKHVK